MPRRSLSKTTEKKGRLAVVGSGIKSVAQCTMEAKREIEAADIVYTLVPDPVAMHWIRQLNANVHSLDYLYHVKSHRWDTYQAMVDQLLRAVRQGKRVTAVYYGHPGVFVYPSHEAIKRARAEGHDAYMQAGISAEDCLFADLGFDPSEMGCQSYEATQFLVWPRRFDPQAALVLWQIGVLGDLSLTRASPLPRALRLLMQKLLPYYGDDHQIALYESPTLDITMARVEWLALRELAHAKPTRVATLFVPPVGELMPDWSVVRALNLPDDNLYFRSNAVSKKRSLLSSTPTSSVVENANG